MSIKGISFCGDMVLAVVENRKSMTRRVIKPQPVGGHMVERNPDGSFEMMCGYKIQGGLADKWVTLKSKYQVGDILYIREGWRIGAWNTNTQSICVDYRADEYCRREWIRIDDAEQFRRYVQQSRDQCKKKQIPIDPDDDYHWKLGQAPTTWRTPRYMPRAIARYWIRVTDARVERLQEITEMDAIAEGFKYDRHGDDYQKFYGNKYGIPVNTSIAKFCRLWDILNASRGYGWGSNPWVWAYTFERCEKPEEASK